MDWERLTAVAKDLGMTKEETLKFFENAQIEQDKQIALKEREREYEREKQEREFEREKELLELKLRLAQLNGVPQDDQSVISASSGSQSPKTTRICPRKLMAPFDERRDDLDAYLHRFERIARGQGWDRREWATALSLCLVGEALSVFGRMPADDSMDYDKVKKTLLQRFRLTAEGFRERFRGCKPENAETAKQFVCRLSNYFERWMEMANVEKTYEGVRDCMVVEQFLNCCSNKLSVFLKERKVASLDDVAEHADQYLEAQGFRNLGKANEGCDKARTDETKGRPQGVPNTSQRPLRCFLCNRIGHRAMNCRTGDGRSQVVVCQLCNRRGHRANECRSGTTDKVACIVDSQDSSTREVGTKDKVACIVDSQRDSVEEGQQAQKEESGKNESKLYSQGDGLPVVDGEVHGQRVKVLRDTGTNIVLVKRSLVDESNLTGEYATVILVDSSVRRLPEARIKVASPYYTGWVTAKCLEKPMYDLILGNVPGVRKVDEPDTNWENNRDVVDEQNTTSSRVAEQKESRKKESCHERVREVQTPIAEVALAAITRAAAKREAEATRLKVASMQSIDVTPREFREEQKKDESLKGCFHKVGEPFKKQRSRNVFEFQIHDGLLYRRCQFSSGREVLQLMVPKAFRKAILILGHDSAMAGHQGVKNTLTRITEEFFWPGIQSEVIRYVKSCDVCQHTVPNGRVGRKKLFDRGKGGLGVNMGY